MGSFPPRTTYLTPEEMCRFLEWTDENIDGSKRPSNQSTVVDFKQSSEAIGLDLTKVAEDVAMEVDSSTSEIESATKELIKETSETATTHPLNQLKLVFENLSMQLKDGSITIGTVDVNDVDIGLVIINNLLKTLNEKKPQEKNMENPAEVVLPPSESLSELYTLRPVYVLVERIGNESWPVFWLTSVPPAFELEAENGESELVFFFTK